MGAEQISSKRRKENDIRATGLTTETHGMVFELRSPSRREQNGCHYIDGAGL
jgi:hypothetical protein